MSKHHAIIKLHHAGVSNSIIIKQLKVSKSTVYDIVARFKELGDDKDRPRSGCPHRACTPKIIKAAHERVRRNPKQSIKKMNPKQSRDEYESKSYEDHCKNGPQAFALQTEEAPSAH